MSKQRLVAAYFVAEFSCCVPRCNVIRQLKQGFLCRGKSVCARYSFTEHISISSVVRYVIREQAGPIICKTLKVIRYMLFLPYRNKRETFANIRMNHKPVLLFYCLNYCQYPTMWFYLLCYNSRHYISFLAQSSGNKSVSNVCCS